MAFMPFDTAVMYLATLSMAGFFGCFVVHMADNVLDRMLEKNEMRKSLLK